jgi:hypothetical protein
MSVEAGDREGYFYLKYTTSGASGSPTEAEHPTFDPKGIKPVLDPDAQATDVTFSAPLLKMAIDFVKSGLPSQDSQAKPVQDYYHSMQLFDASQKDWEKGDGYMFASDGKRGSYFFCEEFKGKNLSIHITNIPAVISFLGRCTGDVVLRRTTNWTFLINSEKQVLGWTHQALSHTRFTYYTEESIQLQVEKDTITQVLSYMQEAVGADTKVAKAKLDEIQVTYTAEDARLQCVLSVKSKVKRHLTTVPLTELAKTTNFAAKFKIQHMQDLFTGIAAHKVVLKMTISPPTGKRKKDYYHFRVTDSFWVDKAGKVLLGKGEGSTECKLTKFIPSADNV